VFEDFDANGNRVQSAPSDVFTVTLTGAQNTITGVTVVGTHSMRIPYQNGTEFDMQSIPRCVLYRTRNNDDGNLTLYRDQSAIVSGTYLGNNGETITFNNVILSDDALSANEVLYSQGERDAQSGNLPFISPEACGSIWPSADRLLSGAIPAASNIQESRNLIPGEQANWSDSIGFFRATRGRVLAVARLDERRIVWTDSEIFELDGEGVDDNGFGTIGAPRRLPSEVGLFGGDQGWQSMVEAAPGIFFRGTQTLIYLLPRGGVSPIAIGLDVQDTLSLFPNVTAAVYVQDDQTVRFTCNNSGNTDSISLIFDLEHQTWLVEGPFGAATLAACSYQGRMVHLRSNIVRQQRVSLTPLAFITNAWRSGVVHPFGLGQFGRVHNAQFYGEYEGDCALRAVFSFDEAAPETVTCEVNALTLMDVNANTLTGSNDLQSFTIAAGAPFSFKAHPGQSRCESVTVDWEIDVPFPSVVALQNAAAANATAINISLPANRAIGDRVVIAFMTSNTTTAVVAAGWTQRSATALAGDQTLTIVERILDGSEASPVAFTWTTQTSCFSVLWSIRNSHPSAAIELLVNGSAAALTTVIAPTVTPSWGLANTLWLTGLALSNRVTAGVTNAVSFPSNFRRIRSSSTISATPNLSGQLSGMDRALRATTLSPGTWVWTDATSEEAFTIAVRPHPTLASAGLNYHYWTMDVEGSGKSALKSPLQMG
jgi:hypothetical protein